MKKSGENRPTVQACPNCGAHKITHTICQACGFYGGKQVIEVIDKTANAAE